MFTLIVTICAVLYAFGSREIQYRFGNRKEVDAINKEMKLLTEKLKEAQKRNDSAQMDSIMKEQTQMMGKLTGTMFGSFKAMGIVIVLFLAITFGLDQLNPTKGDDITLALGDSGTLCDSVAQDGNYTGCYTIPENAVAGEWEAHVIAREGTSEIGDNATHFLVSEGTLGSYSRPAKNKPIPLNINTKVVAPGNELRINAAFEPYKDLRATIDSGTSFYVDLPITIPFFNVSRIHDVYWWFVLVSLLSSLLIIPIVDKVTNKKR